MQTASRFINYLVGLIARAMKKQSTTEDKAVFLMVAVGVALLLIGTITAKYWLPIVFGAGLLLWGLIPTRSKQFVLPIVSVESVYRELFRVFNEIYQRIDVVLPIDLHDIAVMPPVAMRNSIEVIKVKIAKTGRGNFDDERLRMARKFIQARINDHLRSGRVENIPFVSLDGNIPIFWIDGVYDDTATLYIDLIVVDTDEKLNYVINSQFTQATPPPPEPNDEDF